jgi:hypothetical protein
MADEITDILDYVCTVVLDHGPDSSLARTLERNKIFSIATVVQMEEEHFRDLNDVALGEKILLKSIGKYHRHRNQICMPLGSDGWMTVTKEEFDNFCLGNHTLQPAKVGGVPVQVSATLAGVSESPAHTATTTTVAASTSPSSLMAASTTAHRSSRRSVAVGENRRRTLKSASGGVISDMIDLLSEPSDDDGGGGDGGRGGNGPKKSDTKLRAIVGESRNRNIQVCRSTTSCSTTKANYTEDNRGRDSEVPLSFKRRKHDRDVGATWNGFESRPNNEDSMGRSPSSRTDRNNNIAEKLNIPSSAYKSGWEGFDSYCTNPFSKLPRSFQDVLDLMDYLLEYSDRGFYRSFWLDAAESSGQREGIWTRNKLRALQEIGNEDLAGMNTRRPGSRSTGMIFVAL